jgi:hypothetical protein
VVGGVLVAAPFSLVDLLISIRYYKERTTKIVFNRECRKVQIIQWMDIMGVFARITIVSRIGISYFLCLARYYPTSFAAGVFESMVRCEGKL